MSSFTWETEFSDENPKVLKSGYSTSLLQDMKYLLKFE